MKFFFIVSLSISPFSQLFLDEFLGKALRIAGFFILHLLIHNPS